jgi:transitional endoplasmic reticulum ATPase
MPDVEALRKAANQEAILETLFRLGGGQFNVESGITYHSDTNQQIILPKGMSPDTAANALMEYAQAQKEKTVVRQKFDASPGDGAYCLQQTIKSVLGMSGIGKPTVTFFGTQYPETIQVITGLGVDDKVSVPWGRLSVPPLEGTFTLGAVPNDEYGYLFQVEAEVPKKYEPAVVGLFSVLKEQIEKNSIYLGKSFAGVGLDIYNPEREFIDPWKVKRNEVVYAEDVFRILDAEVWGVIRNADTLQAAGQKINTKHLLYGPYGTGKTLAGLLTAQICAEHGWTFIQCNTGDDDLEQVVRWAKLYGKSNKGVVIFVEDIDVLLKGDKAEDPEKMSRMMELFDGFDSKNNRVMMLMTSNHLDAFEAPFTRQGRFDNLIEVAELDRDGVERLLHALFHPDTLDPSLDFDAIYDAMKGYEPAFIRGSFDRVTRSSIVRTGTTGAVLTTDDFVNAAVALRKQWEIHNEKKNEVKPDRSFEQEFRRLATKAAEQALDKYEVEDYGRLVPTDR